MDKGLRAVLYVSELAPDFDARAVGAILSSARRNNAMFGETGVLVFDGERFCQYVEGDTSCIRSLVRNLLGDARHENVQILADLPVTQRAFEQFRMGYTSVEDVQALQSMTRSFASDAVLRFRNLVAHCDIEA